MVGYLLASDVDPMLLGQHWPNDQNVVHPTLFDDIGPTLGQFSYAGWVHTYIYTHGIALSIRVTLNTKPASQVLIKSVISGLPEYCM